jgi:prevent-host-death family protein
MTVMVRFGAKTVKTWAIQEAKAHFSEVLERAQRDGPQTITRHGRPRAVLLSIDAYEDLLKRKMPEPNLIDFLRSGPRFDDFDFERSQDMGREVDLE